MVYRIDFEPAERDALLQLLDLVVKAQGFKVAEASLHFAKKLASATEFHPATEVTNEASKDSQLCGDPTTV